MTRLRDGLHSGHMRANRLPTTLGAAFLAIALTACGGSGPDAADPAADGSAGGNPGTGTGEGEQITPSGIAVIVKDHLGSDAVRQVVTFEPEPGSVSVMVELQDSTPHNFAVQVYSPKHGDGFGKAGRCPPKRQLGREGACRVLDNGTSVTTIEAPYGFSDDNTEGMVISSTAVTQEDGTGMAMYESYDDSPAVSGAEMEAILTDPRLTWLTDPAVNEAGQDVTVKERTG